MKRLIQLTCLLAASAYSLCALDAGNFSALLGYTIIATTNVKGSFEGAEHDKPVMLDNGQIFVFDEYNYSYSYRPDVVIFAKKMSYTGRDLIVYKLLIDDEFYDAHRVK